MIISCPHCQTKYQVTYDAIGSAGRKVQCAHCQEAWDQPPLPKEPPPPLEIVRAEQVLDEDSLDDAMSSEEREAAARAAKAVAAKMEKEKAARAEQEKAAKAAKSPSKDHTALGQTAAGMVDPAVVRKRRRAFSRKPELPDDQPQLQRLRTALRIIGAVLLAGVLLVAFFGREQIVSRFPAMAGVYDTLGLGINVVGLDFSDVETLQTLRNGKEVLIVSAQIVGLAREPVPVPAVVVTLIGPEGQGVYQWSVQPSVRDLMAGERATFETQLTLPPGDASSVRLSFANSTTKRITGGKAPALARPVPLSDGMAIPDAASHSTATQADAEHGAAAASAHTSPEHP